MLLGQNQAGGPSEPWRSGLRQAPLFPSCRPQRDPLDGELLFPIYLPPMANLDDLNGSPFVIDRIYNAVVSLADTISFLTRDLFVAVRAWIPGQCSDPIHNATQVLFRQSTQLTLR